MGRRGLRRGLALAGVLALLAASCGDDDDDDGGAVDTTAASDTTAAPSTTASPQSSTSSGEAAGTTTAAGDSSREGETITIGYVNNEGPVFSLPEFRIGGEVAIDVINANGGVDGATIEAESCIADASPEGSIGCANQFIEAGVDLVYAGIDVASDAMLPLLSEAGIPYVSSNSWGPAQRNDPNSFILHTAAGAFGVTPLKILQDLGHQKIGVVIEDTPAGQDYIENTVQAIGVEKLGLDIETAIVDPANPDWTTAVTTLQAAGAEAMYGQLTEPGCIGLVTATNSIGFDGPVFAGSCSLYIDVLGEAAIGTYTQGDLYFPDTREFAPPEIQERLDEYVEAMTAAGQEQYINGFAVAPYSALFELAAILGTIEGDITSESIVTAFQEAGTQPGWLGPDTQCGQQPWPTEVSHCRGDIIAWEVVAGDGGAPKRVLLVDWTNDSDLVG
jgi:branched-chain amino acid transport system substrate-binding protein